MRILSASIIIAMIALASTTKQAVCQNITETTARGGDFRVSESDSTDVVERFTLYYWRDRIDLDDDYLDNAAQMAHIRRYLALSPHIDSIIIYAYASPEARRARRSSWTT